MKAMSIKSNSPGKIQQQIIKTITEEFEANLLIVKIKYYEQIEGI